MESKCPGAPKRKQPTDQPHSSSTGIRLHPALVALTAWTLLVAACVPMLRSSGAAPTPTDWSVFDHLRGADQVLVLPVWSTTSSHQEGRPGRRQDVFGPIALLPVHALDQIPARIGVRGSAGLLTASTAIGSSTEFEGAYLFSNRGDLLLLKSARVERDGTRWRAVLRARLSHAWRDEILHFLGREEIRPYEMPRHSFWNATYKIRGYEDEFRFGLRLHPNSLAASDHRLLREFMLAIPPDKISRSGSTWEQVFRN
jgi:hypothetical protein